MNPVSRIQLNQTINEPGNTILQKLHTLEKRSRPFDLFNSQWLYYMLQTIILQLFDLNILQEIIGYRQMTTPDIILVHLYSQVHISQLLNQF